MQFIILQNYNQASKKKLYKLQGKRYSGGEEAEEPT